MTPSDPHSHRRGLRLTKRDHERVEDVRRRYEDIGPLERLERESGYYRPRPEPPPSSIRVNWVLVFLVLGFILSIYAMWEGF